MKIIIVISALVLCVCGSVPSNFPRCKKSDPYLNKCLIDGVETMRPALIAGMPDVGIPAIDPFVLTPFEINRQLDNIKFKGTIQGKGYGGGAFKIDKLAVSMKDKNVLDLDLTIPTLKINADYNVNELNILMFDFNGKGKFNGDFSNVKASVKITSTPTYKNEVEYLKLEDVTVAVQIADGTIDVKDEKHSFLAWTMARFFNASPSVVLNIVAPLINGAATEVVKDILTEAFDKIPTNKIIVSN